MKNLTYIFLVVLLFFSSCKPDIPSDPGEPFDKVAGLNGTWVLHSFIQQDLNNPIKEERDLSKYYVVEGTNPLSITFNASDKSYSIDITEGKNFFGDGGEWNFDNDQYPSFVTLESGSETNVFGLGSVVREFDNTLTLQLEKGCSETELNVIYKFIFERAQ